MIDNNKLLAKNVLGSFFIKGIGMMLSIVAMPLYMDYFSSSKSLGLWFTILSVLSWILALDMGIGNGLRNHLTKAMALQEKERCRQLISSAYAMLGSITLLVILALVIALPLLNFNSFFNISGNVISSSALRNCILITLVGIVLSFFLRIANSLLYALQLAAINNLNSLITNILMVAFLFIVPPSTNDEVNLEIIAIAYALIINLPLIITTILIFSRSQLKDSKPSFRYISWEASKQVLSLGLTFLFLQVLYMIITVTNEWLITYFFDVSYCVDYQIYYRIFSLFGTLFGLALSPMWSAITKALAENRYGWIIKLQRILYIMAFTLIALQIAILPVLQVVINIWLREKAIIINYSVASCFILYSVVSIWISVQSTIVAGLGTLKVQLYGYTFAVLFKTISIAILAQYTDNWVVVVLMTAFSLLPYSIVQPIVLRKKINELQLKSKF